MSLTRLRTFIEVYRQRSISGAARSLNLTQPAVSQHIMGLEVVVGKPLFQRTPQGVEPTSVAHELAMDIGDKLDAAEAALASARARSMDIAGVLQIVGHADFLSEVLSEQLLPLLKEGIKVRLHSGSGASVSTMLLEGHCDLGISAHPVVDSRLKTEKIYTTRVLPVASPEVVERISGADDFADALRKESLLAYNLELSLVESWQKKNHIDLDIPPSLVCQDLRAHRKLLMKGFGWTVMPEFLCQEAIAKGELAEIPSPIGTAEIPYYLIWVAGSLSKIRIAHARQILLQNLR